MLEFEDLISIFHSNHLYPAITIENGRQTGIEIYAPGLQADRRMEIAKEVCGEKDFRFTHFPNDEKIVIQAKKK